MVLERDARKGQGRIKQLFCHWKKLEGLKVLYRKPLEEIGVEWTLMPLSCALFKTFIKIIL